MTAGRWALTALFSGAFAAWVWQPSARRVARARGQAELRDDRGTRAFLLIMLFIGVTLGFVFAAAVPSAAIPGGLAAPAIGVCLMWGSVAFALWAQRTLGAMYRPIVAIQPNHAVVARGPYRLLRHPIYAAGIVVMAGIGLADGNWISLATCVVFAFLGYLRRIRVEERVLVEHLGEEYLDYERGRRRLIPWVW